MTKTNETIIEFEKYLMNEEKSPATVRKYTHDAAAFLTWIDSEGDTPTEFAPLRGEMSPEATKGCKGTHPNINKEVLLAYKDYLKRTYAPASVNAAISSLNSFFEFIGRSDLRLKPVKMQRRIFAPEERELKREEYNRLRKTAERLGKKRLLLILNTILATGIRVSELRFVTVESLSDGVAHIDCKGKYREVFICRELCQKLKKYAKERGITSGSIFITRNGNPIDRSNLSKELKKLAAAANVAAKKVFPHNIRHLFARIYYNAHKDIGKLADILGHSNINTTRIYIMDSGAVHRRQIEALGLL